MLRLPSNVRYQFSIPKGMIKMLAIINYRGCYIIKNENQKIASRLMWHLFYCLVSSQIFTFQCSLGCNFTWHQQFMLCCMFDIPRTKTCPIEADAIRIIKKLELIALHLLSTFHAKNVVLIIVWDKKKRTNQSIQNSARNFQVISMINKNYFLISKYVGLSYSKFLHNNSQNYTGNCLT